MPATTENKFIPGMNEYDPKQYWNTKAKNASGNACLAACGANQHENRCIETSQIHALEKALSLIKRNNISGKSVLDFGCGSGRWTDYFTGLGANYFGIDISEEMISLSRNRYPQQNFKSFDGLNIPFEPNSFDMIYSIAVIHHNRPAQQEKILAEISRVLKPGGYLFLFEGLGTEERQREFPHTMKQWISLVENNGFTCLMNQGYGYYLLTDAMNNSARKLRIPRIYNWRPAILLGLDAVLSPRLTPFLPDVFHDRGAMLFRHNK